MIHNFKKSGFNCSRDTKRNDQVLICLQKGNCHCLWKVGLHLWLGGEGGTLGGESERAPLRGGGGGGGGDLSVPSLSPSSLSSTPSCSPSFLPSSSVSCVMHRSVCISTSSLAIIHQQVIHPAFSIHLSGCSNT